VGLVYGGCCSRQALSSQEAGVWLLAIAPKTSLLLLLGFLFSGARLTCTS